MLTYLHLIDKLPFCDIINDEGKSKKCYNVLVLITKNNHRIFQMQVIFTSFCSLRFSNILYSFSTFRKRCTRDKKKFHVQYRRSTFPIQLHIFFLNAAHVHIRMNIARI